MSSGQKAADQTKGVFKQAQDAGEGLRKNVNSFADNLLGGTKTHSSTGIHPDAKKAGNDLEEGVKDAGKKLDKMADKHKR